MLFKRNRHSVNKAYVAPTELEDCFVPNASHTTPLPGLEKALGKRIEYQRHFVVIQFLIVHHTLFTHTPYA